MIPVKEDIGLFLLTSKRMMGNWEKDWPFGQSLNGILYIQVTYHDTELICYIVIFHWEPS